MNTFLNCKTILVWVKTPMFPSFFGCRVCQSLKCHCCSSGESFDDFTYFGWNTFQFRFLSSGKTVSFATVWYFHTFIMSGLRISNQPRHVMYLPMVIICGCNFILLYLSNISQMKPLYPYKLFFLIFRPSIACCWLKV